MPPPKTPNAKRGTIHGAAAQNLAKFTIRAAPLPAAIMEFLLDNLAIVRRLAQERKASEGEAYVADMPAAERMRAYLGIHTQWRAISQFAQECGFIRYQERNWYFSNYERGYTPSDEE